MPACSVCYIYVGEQVLYVPNIISYGVYLVNCRYILEEARNICKCLRDW